MDAHEQDTHISDSDHSPVTTEGADGMGVSSERIGPTGPGQVGPTGTRDVSEVDHDQEADADVPPEQAAGGPEENPDPPIAPVAGYNSHDPRSKDNPF